MGSQRNAWVAKKIRQWQSAASIASCWHQHLSCSAKTMPTDHCVFVLCHQCLNAVVAVATCVMLWWWKSSLEEIYFMAIEGMTSMHFNDVHMQHNKLTFIRITCQHMKVHVGIQRTLVRHSFLLQRTPPQCGTLLLISTSVLLWRIKRVQHHHFHVPDNHWCPCNPGHPQHAASLIEVKKTDASSEAFDAHVSVQVTLTWVSIEQLTHFKHFQEGILPCTSVYKCRCIKKSMLWHKK